MAESTRAIPLPLPAGPMFFSGRELEELTFPLMPTQDKIDLAELKEYVGNFTLENGLESIPSYRLGKEEASVNLRRISKPIPSL